MRGRPSRGESREEPEIEIFPQFSGPRKGSPVPGGYMPGPHRGVPVDPSGPRVDSSLPPTGPAAWRGLPLDRRELARQHAPVQSGTRSGEDRPGRAPPGFSFGGKYKGQGVETDDRRIPVRYAEPAKHTHAVTRAHSYSTTER